MKTLDYSSKDLKEFPIEIFEQKDVEALDLSTHTGHWDTWLNPNIFSTIPDRINEIRNLKRLNLSRTEVRALPETFRDLKNLTFLDLSSTKLNEIPGVVFQLYNLETLIMEDCQIELIPADILKLKNLRVLNLNNDRIKGIPAEIGKLDKLEELHLYNNLLVELPKEIGELRNLRILELGSYENDRNRINILPREIGNLKKLEYIHLGNNKLKTLPIELAACVSLKKLVLWSNEFEEIPEWLSELHLTELNFYSNPIKEIPANYGFLTKIKDLTLDERLDEQLAEKSKWWKFW
ncbi:MAG: hypothetical protein JST19_01545 [Bacteroidetes bacterium]|nr:hypothetical protein [Bacteroidota bacterium]